MQSWFRQKQELPLLADKFQKFYPQDVSSEAVGADRDAHIAYYEEIVGAYIAEYNGSVVKTKN